jgi:hypothetical protein
MFMMIMMSMFATMFTLQNNPIQAPNLVGEDSQGRRHDFLEQEFPKNLQHYFPSEDPSPVFEAKDFCLPLEKKSGANTFMGRSVQITVNRFYYRG